MKKMLSFVAVALFMLTLCACSENTPEEVTAKAIQCIIDKDYKGYVDMMSFKEEKTDEQKQQLVALVREKMDKEIEKKEGIKDFSVGIPDVHDQEASVPYTLTYGNGDTKDDRMKLVQNENGKWMIDSGK